MFWFTLELAADLFDFNQHPDRTVLIELDKTLVSRQEPRVI